MVKIRRGVCWPWRLFKTLDGVVRWRWSRPGSQSVRPLEICWQDEARAGQKNKITQPLAPKDHRTKSAFIFGAICPTCSTGAAVVVLRCDTAAMQWHLNEIATQVAPSAHGVVLLDQAGWHATDKLDLPPQSPEFNPFENVWKYMRENWLSNRVFSS